MPTDGPPCQGAYWDTEVKRAQERGLADYPVYTRKAMTDLRYLGCVRQLLAARPRLYAQFATHNALTVACVIEDAGGTAGYEFQRLHGMGEAPDEALIDELPDLTCRVYAPVGGYSDLLAYLVRRLLENGANSSFVSVEPIPRFLSKRFCAARRTGSPTHLTRDILIFLCLVIFLAPTDAIPPALNSAIARRWKVY